MSNNYQVRVDYWMKPSEKAIHFVFNDFAKELDNRKREMLQEIINWRDAKVREIEEHASKQRSFLDQEFHRQGNFIQNSREQFINAVQPYVQIGDRQQIDQLIAQCKALKYELGAIEFSESSILFIQFMTEEQIARKKRDEKKADRTEGNKPPINSAGGYDNISTNNSGAYASATSKLVSGHMEHTNQPSNTTRSSNKNAPPSNNNDNRYPNTNSGDISMDECPVCSMSFPSHMTRPEQATHINAHFQES